MLEAPYLWGEPACNAYTEKAPNQGFLARGSLILGLELVRCFGHAEGVGSVILIDFQVCDEVEGSDEVENLSIGILCVNEKDAGDGALLAILALEAVTTELIREEVKLYGKHVLGVTVENGSGEVGRLLLEDFPEVDGGVVLDTSAVTFDNARFENCGEGGGGGQYGHCIFPFWVVSVLL